MSSIYDTHYDDIGLAEFLKVSTRTTKRWRDRGEGPPLIRLGGKLYYNKESVDRWLAAREVAA
jgi:predicted site-specific integrase-resolvase